MTDNEGNFNINQSKPEDTRGWSEIEAAFKKIDSLKDPEENEDNFEEEPQEPEDSNSEEEEVEEISEEYEEDESTEESLKETLKKPEKAWKEKKKRFKAQAETRLAQEEKRRVLEENAQLKELLRQAEAAGTYQYGKNIYSELERAKQLKRKAVEDNDLDASIDADVYMNKVIHDIRELEKWSAIESAQPQKQQSDSSEHHEEVLARDISQEWLSTHKELQPNSRYYNPKLAEKTAEYIYALDAKLDASGNTQAYLSDEYFEVIDDFIENQKNKTRSEKTQKNIGSIGNVGSVRNSYSNSLHNTAKTQKVSLTAAEKELAKIGGISEEEWARRKINISKMVR